MFYSGRIPASITEKLFALLAPAYACDINCVLEFDGRIEPERLTTAFLAALAEEPMWSHRFVEAYWRPYWEPIRRDERHQLVSSSRSIDSATALRKVMLGPIDAAARVFHLQGPENDTLCFRVDHRLADATATRLLVESVARHYQQRTSEPERDAPLVRRTLSLLDEVVSVPQRREMLNQFRQQVREQQRLLPPYPIQFPTADDPVDLPPILHFPEGSLDELRQRALRDRGTPTFAVLAALYLSLREITEWNPNAEMRVGMAVNLRRYLPAVQLPCPASMFLGRVFCMIPPETTTMSAAMESIRSGFAQQRGPHFGLVISELSCRIPILRQVMEYIPFGALHSNAKHSHRRLTKRSQPDVQVSDIGEFGQPGDQWGEAHLRDACCSPGRWGVPGSITANIGNFGSRISISVAAGPRSFAETLADTLRRKLCEYVGWPETTALTKHAPGS